MPNASIRGRVTPQSPIRKLVPLADAAKARGIKVYHLNIGQPDIETPEVALNAIRNIDRSILEYSPSEGYLSFREKLVKYYKEIGIKLKPEEILITAGGSEAVLFAFLSCLNPGDEIIVPEPAYANYLSFAVSAGVFIKPIPTHIESSFALPSVDEFEKYIGPRTKGILICNPNNPTGYVYSAEEMKTLEHLIKKYDLYLFSDEVYREFIYTEEPYISACHLKGVQDNVILIDSVSKRYSECGIRIGALITKNKKVREIVLKLCQARLSPPLIGQIAAEASLDTPKDYLKAVNVEYKKRRDCLVDGLNKIEGVFTPVPSGAFYTVVKLPVKDAEDFCKWMLSDFSYKGETIMMAPANGFYITEGLGKDEVRLAYVLNCEELKKAIKVLEMGLKAYNKR
ncbi:MAG: pyridoxal phosphate-dependent aminotransferase [Bacteroidales bacterium]|nr:pyridoxal phosphate-dependent aminotransferase [Bacteroidales bacterium]